MEKRTFARGQKKGQAANIMQEEGKSHQIGGIKCVPPAVRNRRFDEEGLLITDPAIALEKCKRQESCQLVASIKTNGARDWKSMPLEDLPCPRDKFGEEMAKGDRRDVCTGDVRVTPSLKSQTRLKCARGAISGLERLKLETAEDHEKLTAVEEAEDIIRQHFNVGSRKQKLF